MAKCGIKKFRARSVNSQRLNAITEYTLGSVVQTVGFFCIFSNRVVNRWNLLDQWTVDAPSLNAFKNSLSRIRDKRMGFFMDWVRQAPGHAGGGHAKCPTWDHKVPGSILGLCQK